MSIVRDKGSKGPFKGEILVFNKIYPPVMTNELKYDLVHLMLANFQQILKLDSKGPVTKIKD